MKRQQWLQILEIVCGRRLDPARLPPNLDARTLRQIQAFRSRHRSWLRQRLISGFAIGRKQVAGRHRRQHSLIVYVTRKRPQAHCTFPIPARVRLPSFGWIPTDVQERPRMRTHAFTGQERPIRPGCSVGFHLPTAGFGTLTCIVSGTKPGEAGRRYILSCEHVLANNLRRREEIFGAQGTLKRTIEQPAPSFQLQPGTDFTIARIERAGGVRFGGFTNTIDAAIAVIAAAVPSRNTTLGLDLPITGIGPVRVGARVAKIGSATAVKHGRITEQVATLPIEYVGEVVNGPKRSALFAGVVPYACESAPGDSGAPVIDLDTNQLVGIHIAGEGTHSVMCPMEAVCRILSIAVP